MTDLREKFLREDSALCGSDEPREYFVVSEHEQPRTHETYYRMSGLLSKESAEWRAQNFVEEGGARNAVIGKAVDRYERRYGSVRVDPIQRGRDEFGGSLATAQPTPQQGAEVPEGECLPLPTVAELISQGWIAWSGGECPVDADATVQIAFGSGDGLDTGWMPESRAADVDWSNTNPADVPIIAYRILESEEGEDNNFVPAREDDLVEAGLRDEDGSLETVSDISADPAFDGDGASDPDLTLSLDTGEVGPFETDEPSASAGSSEQPEATFRDPLKLAGGGGSPPEPTSANAYWGQRYQPASEEQKQSFKEEHHKAEGR